jgi:hypothetical protein
MAKDKVYRVPLDVSPIIIENIVSKAIEQNTLTVKDLVYQAPKSKMLRKAIVGAFVLQELEQLLKDHENKVCTEVCVYCQHEALDD